VETYTKTSRKDVTILCYDFVQRLCDTNLFFEDSWPRPSLSDEAPRECGDIGHVDHGKTTLTAALDEVAADKGLAT